MRIFGGGFVVRDRLLQRMGWIEASLRIAGRFESGERAAYIDRFGLSPAQASHDQQAFVQEFNRRVGASVIEVEKRKIFVARTAAFPSEPVFPIPDVVEWLSDALGSSFYRVRPVHRAHPDCMILRSVVAAIRGGYPLEIVYWSRSSGKSRKVISPHVIVHVVDRLHARAYDHTRNEFSDFVLSRIEDSRPADPNVSFVHADKDEAWRRHVTIEVRAKPGLDGERLQGVLKDFGLDQRGRRSLKQRAPIAPYLVNEPEEIAPGFGSPVVISIHRKEADS